MTVERKRPQSFRSKVSPNALTARRVRTNRAFAWVLFGMPCAWRSAMPYAIIRFVTRACVLTALLSPSVGWAQESPTTPPGDRPIPDPLAAPTAPTLPEVTPEAPPPLEPVPLEDSPEAAPPLAPVEPVEAPATAPSIRLTSSEVAPREPCNCDDEDAVEGQGAFLLGVGAFDFSALDDRLTDNGYESLANTAMFIGGEGHGIMPSGFVAGVRGAALVYPEVSGPGSFQGELAGGYGMFDMGYALVRQRHFLLTATAGIGGYGWSLSLSPQQAASFDEVLADPARSSTVSQAGVLVGLSLGASARVPMGPLERGQRGFFTIGVRLGALYGPSLGDIGLDDGGDLSDAPSVGLTGAFAAVAIGFGGMRE